MTARTSVRVGPEDQSRFARLSGPVPVWPWTIRRPVWTGAWTGSRSIRANWATLSPWALRPENATTGCASTPPDAPKTTERLGLRYLNTALKKLTQDSDRLRAAFLTFA